MPDSPRIALVGCGAIAERFHLPALMSIAGVRDRLVFVDPSEGRRLAVREKAGAGSVSASLESVLQQIDGAIVTAPHALHGSLSRILLGAGVPVLCEKPLAQDAAEASALCDLAEKSNVVFAVNNTRRLYPSNQRIKQMIDGGELGEVRSLTWYEGDKFDWPIASPSLFGRASGGHGILLDIGAHVVDLASWWLGPSLEVVSYSDDAMGGSEAWACAKLKSKACQVELTLSWLSRLQNRFVIEGSRATITAGIYDWSGFDLMRDGRRSRIECEGRGASLAGFAGALVTNFVDSVAGKAAPLVPARSVVPSIALIQDCYSRRTRVPMPWIDAWQKVVA